MSIANLIYCAAGFPQMDGSDAGTCRICGNPGVGRSFTKWVRPTFNDLDKIVPGQIICHACLFIFEDMGNHLLRAITGKEKHQRMRNYSHFVVDGKWIPLSKGKKPEMRRLLLEESPSVAVIADSGQKHIIFRARLGWWQFEETPILPDTLALWTLIETMTALLAVFAKSEIVTANYAASRIGVFGIERWTEMEGRLRKHRGSPMFALALFLSQKEGDGTSGVG